MPWRETCVMEERMAFVVAVRADVAALAEVCRRFGISRTTGYRWLERVEQEGVNGLNDRSRARKTQAHATPPASIAAVLALKRRYPSWGPKKVAARLHTLQAAGEVAADLVIPAPSTVGAVLAQHGLVHRRAHRPRRPGRTRPLAPTEGPNSVWCADFKGQFALGDGATCYPFTLTDAASRYLLRCQALARTDAATVAPLFEAAFREYGLPAALRTDNGPPFASTGLGGLSPLVVSWVKLGIVLDRIDPGRPQQNGRHERMHRTLGEDPLAAPAASLAAQQRGFTAFRDQFNTERPHEALGMATPASAYVTSTRPYPTRVPELVYPDADHVRQVRHNGMMRWQGAMVYVTQTLAGEPVGVSWVADGQWLLHFGPILLGVLDERGAACEIFPASGRPRAPARPSGEPGARG